MGYRKQLIYRNSLVHSDLGVSTNRELCGQTNNSKINSYSSIVQKRTLTTPGIQLRTKYVVPEPNPTKFRGHDMKIGAEQQCMKNPCGLPSRLQPKRLNGRTQNNRGDLDYHHVDWKEHCVGVGGGWNWVRNCREKIKKSKRKRNGEKYKHQPSKDIVEVVVVVVVVCCCCCSV